MAIMNDAKEVARSKFSEQQHAAAGSLGENGSEGQDAPK